MQLDERGAKLREFPQTMSLKNWPFLAFLAFLALVPAYGGYASDHLTGGLLIGAAILFVPLVAVLVQVFGGFFVARVTALHDGGLVVRRFGRDTLVPYSSVRNVALRQESVEVEGVRVGRQFVITVDLHDAPTLEIWPMSEGAEAAVDIAERAGLKVQG